jgi:hypothetical protein
MFLSPLDPKPGKYGHLNPLQMRVFKGCWVLQAEAQHPVHTDMREPDERDGNAGCPPGCE